MPDEAAAAETETGQTNNYFWLLMAVLSAVIAGQVLLLAFSKLSCGSGRKGRRGRQAPLGFIPLQACVVYAEASIWIVTTMNHLCQFFIFVDSEDYACALICWGFLFTTWFMTGYALHQYEASPLYIAKETLAHGYATLAWVELRAADAVIQAPGFGIVAPYGMLFNKNLSGIEVVSATLGFLMSVRGLVANSLCTFRGDAREEALRALYPRVQEAVWAWCWLGMASELACFALASAILHPALVAPIYLLSACSNAWETDRKFWCCLSVLQPHFLCFGGLRAMSDIDSMEGIPRPLSCWLLVLTAWRQCMLVMLVSSVDWPEGVARLWNLRRPMGRPVLDKEFLQPTSMTLEIVMQGGSHSSVAGETHAFKFFVLAVWVLTTPVYLVGCVVLLFWRLCGGDFCAQDEGIEARVRRKQEAIIAWGEAHAVAAGFHPVPLGEDVYVESVQEE